METEKISVAVLTSEINNWFIVLDKIQKIEVTYNENQLTMANEAIEKIKEEALTVLNGVNMYTDFNIEHKEN